MTCPLAIQGIGLVAGFGFGNESALRAIQNSSGPNHSIPVQTRDGSIDYPVYAADSDPLKQYIKPAKLRRINKYSRLASLAACLALEDAGFDLPANDLNLAVIVSSGYGASTTTFEFLDDVILEGDEFASPTQFSNSVHSSAASHVTILLQIQGPCLTVTQFEMSTVAAFFNAQAWLKEGRVDAVLLGGVDEVNPVLVYCYQNLWNIQVPQVMEPLNFQKQTAIPGEGAVFLLLTRDKDQSARYGCISNVSWTNSTEFQSGANDILIPAVDGHRQCGLRYRELLIGLDPDRIRTFSQLTGSIPSGQMFDIALASLAAEKGLMSGNFCSLKIDSESNAGIIFHRR